MAGRTLHVRCATWDQVEQFTTRKLRKGRLLSMKVPFVAKTGLQVTLGLELPNDVVVAIDGVVQKAAPEPDASRTWIEIELVGFTDEVRARLETLSRSGSEPVPSKAGPVRATTYSGMGDDLPADERALFQHLSTELRRLRQAAVHDVLGVAADADPDQVRRKWQELIRRNHPDLVARRQAPAITHLAEELTILANRAYDRMRARLSADGHATVAGASLAAPPGWLVGFEDLQSGEGLPAAAKRSPNKFERPATPTEASGASGASGASASGPVSVPGAGQGSDAYDARARALLAQGDSNGAREILAAALVVYPRSKPLRSLYYVATALTALQDGEVMLATTQLETALAHHEQCNEASRLLDHVRRHGAAQPDIWKKVWR